MNKCLYCYKGLKETEKDYHVVCAKAFFGTKVAPVLPYQLAEMEVLAKESAMLSITVPGVQPKLSLGWQKGKAVDGFVERLTITDALDGHYILKPQNVEYAQMPENEHLTMKLAKLFKINIVPVSLIRLASGELCFVAKRIDRNKDGSKNHMIDFLQIMGLSDKYLGTMEKLGKTIGELSANSLFDKLRFFEVTVFNFVVGNNDMHLKNFSMLLQDKEWTLSPFYDLLNVKLILPSDKDDSALMMGGKKQNFNKAYFDRFGANLQLNEKQIKGVYNRLRKWLPEAMLMIDESFLERGFGEMYKDLIMSRVGVFIEMNPA